MYIIKSFVFVSLAATALGKQVANLNVSASEVSSMGCDAKCFKELQMKQQIDFATVGIDFDESFYSTATNFSTSQPGDLLKFQALDPKRLNVKPGTSAFRFQYTSLTLNGTKVPVTGFIAFPYLINSGRRFRLAAYAHGTIGLYSGCAPSNGPSLFDYNSWSLLIDRGYAVVATDYAGLGNNYTTHKYLTFPDHANDVYFSVMAARKYFGSVLTREWVSVGHSQGGGAVWKLAESSLLHNDEEYPYLGTVSLAPGTFLADMILVYRERIAPRSDIHNFVVTGEVPSAVIGLKRFLPSYNMSVLGPTLRKRLALFQNAQLCDNGVMGLTLDLPIKELFSIEGIKADYPKFVQWQNQTAPALGDRSAAPILVLQGMNDTAVFPDVTLKAWKSACTSGNEVHLRLYPGVDHSALVPVAAAEWLAWIDERFAGISTCGSCSKVTAKPFAISHAELPSEITLDQDN